MEISQISKSVGVIRHIHSPCSADVLMFETDDLVLRKNEKNFVLCLLEVARRASRFGMAAPVLIQLEQEIEEEICEELHLPLGGLPKVRRARSQLSDFRDLDEMVRLGELLQNLTQQLVRHIQLKVMLSYSM